MKTYTYLSQICQNMCHTFVKNIDTWRISQPTNNNKKKEPHNVTPFFEADCKLRLLLTPVHRTLFGLQHPNHYDQCEVYDCRTWQGMKSHEGVKPVHKAK